MYARSEFAVNANRSLSRINEISERKNHCGHKVSDHSLRRCITKSGIGKSENDIFFAL